MKHISCIVILLNIFSVIANMISGNIVAAWAFFNVALAWGLIFLLLRMLDNKNRKDYD